MRKMLVHELIQLLQSCNPVAEVMVSLDNINHYFYLAYNTDGKGNKYSCDMVRFCVDGVMRTE